MRILFYITLLWFKIKISFYKKLRFFKKIENGDITYFGNLDRSSKKETFLFNDLNVKQISCGNSFFVILRNNGELYYQGSPGKQYWFIIDKINSIINIIFSVSL